MLIRRSAKGANTTLTLLVCSSYLSSGEVALGLETANESPVAPRQGRRHGYTILPRRPPSSSCSSENYSARGRRKDVEPYLNFVQNLCQGGEPDAEPRNADIACGLGGETRPRLYHAQREAGCPLHAGQGSALLGVVFRMAAMCLK